MKRIAIAGALIALAVPFTASAALHEVSVGNYYYEHDETGARDPLVAKQGDQIRFTIREADVPPHSVNIDEYGIRSGDLLLFETYTTPPLDQPGTFTLYCRAHRDKGHITTLIVEEKKTKPASEPPPEEEQPPPPEEEEVSSEETGSKVAGETERSSGGKQRRKAKRSNEEDAAAVAPTGRGVATDQRRAPPEPDSLEAILGRRVAAEGPWTRSVGLALLAALPIAGAAAFALRQEARRRIAKDGP